MPTSNVDNGSVNYPAQDILENTAYHRRLLMYKGLEKPEALLNTESPDPTQIATQGYGVANYYFVTGDKAKARQYYSHLVAMCPKGDASRKELVEARTFAKKG